MAENEIYRVEIPIVVDDQTEQPLQQAERRISRFEKSAQKTNERIRRDFQRIAKLKIEPIMRVRDQLTSNVLAADKLIRKLDVAQASPLIAAQDRVSAVITRVNAMLDALDKGKVDVFAEMQGPLIDEIVKAKSALSALNNVRAGPVAELRGELFGQLSKAMSQIKGLDMSRAEPQATLRERIIWKVREVTASLRGLTSRAWTVTLQAKNKITGSINSIISKLTSPLALLGGGAGLYGLGKMTVGAAAQFEQYTASMEHWLKGNSQLAQEVMRWVEEFSDITPFTPEQLFPAMARAINIEKGMVEPAKRLVQLSGEMAALTPGKTVLDAMEALADAQMGEFERMKEFGMKITQEQYKAMGGWAGFLVKAENTFAGGMKRLSTTSTGLLSTILGRIQTLFRSAGLGMLEAIEPRLQRIVDWFDENKQVVERWKNALIRFGRQGAERVLDFFERAFTRITRFFNDPKFENATFSEKVRMLVEAGLNDVISWLEGPGGETIKKTGETLGILLAAGLEGALPNIVPVAITLGAAIGKGILQGFGEMLMSSPIDAIISGALGGAAIGSVIPGVGTAAGAFAGGLSGFGTWAISKLFTKHQYGGILTHPHLGLVAEAGPEAIIPLSAGMRNRALALYEETGRRLGVRPYAEGGFVGAVPVAAPTMAGFTPTAQTTRAPISVINYIDVSVNGSNSDPDKIAEVIATKIESVFQNMPNR